MKRVKQPARRFRVPKGNFRRATATNRRIVHRRASRDDISIPAITVSHVSPGSTPSRATRPRVWVLLALLANLASGRKPRRQLPHARIVPTDNTRPRPHRKHASTTIASQESTFPVQQVTRRLVPIVRRAGIKWRAASLLVPCTHALPANMFQVRRLTHRCALHAKPHGSSLQLGKWPASKAPAQRVNS